MTDRIIIVWGERVNYGPAPEHVLAPGQKWKIITHCPHVEDSPDHAPHNCPEPVSIRYATETEWTVPKWRKSAEKGASRQKGKRYLS